MTDNLIVWERELVRDKKRDFILSGLKHGFDIVDKFDCFEEVDCDNYSSATSPETRGKVEQVILEELQAGNYKVAESKPAIVSALGAVPKQDSDEIRVIHDASRPPGKSLNTFATDLKCQYTSLDKVIDALPPEGWLAKVDLRHAYRSVPVSPTNYPATGLKWKFSGSRDYVYMYDARLPFGAKRSPSIFQDITESVVRMMARRGHTVQVYLDDFIIISSSQAECEAAYHILLDLLQELGFDISW